MGNSWWRFTFVEIRLTIQIIRFAMNLGFIFVESCRAAAEASEVMMHANPEKNNFRVPCTFLDKASKMAA